MTFGSKYLIRTPLRAFNEFEKKNPVVQCSGNASVGLPEMEAPAIMQIIQNYDSLPGIRFFKPQERFKHDLKLHSDEAADS